MCIFEHIYFSRPDTKLEGKRLQEVRGRMGEILWREAPAEADLVIAVPDSGTPAARGYARASGLPQDDGLIKNRYVARTFIQPGQELRKHGLRMKFNPLPEIISGQRVVVVDDSIVRGNTTRQIVGMLRDAGAKEVHLRISARRFATAAITGLTCRPVRRWSPTSARSRKLPSTSAPTRSPTSRWKASTKRSAPRPRSTATPASPATTRSATTRSSRRRFDLEQIAVIPATR